MLLCQLLHASPCPPPCPLPSSCCPYLPHIPVFLFSLPSDHHPSLSKLVALTASNTTGADRPNTWINSSPRAGCSPTPTRLAPLKVPSPLCRCVVTRIACHCNTFGLHSTTHALALNVAPLTPIQSVSRTPRFLLQNCAACRPHHYLGCFFTISSLAHLACSAVCVPQFCEYKPLHLAS